MPPVTILAEKAKMWDQEKYLLNISVQQNDVGQTELRIQFSSAKSGRCLIFTGLKLVTVHSVSQGKFFTNNSLFFTMHIHVILDTQTPDQCSLIMRNGLNHLI